MRHCLDNSPKSSLVDWVCKKVYSPYFDCQLIKRRPHSRTLGSQKYGLHGCITNNFLFFKFQTLFENLLHWAYTYASLCAHLPSAKGIFHPSAEPCAELVYGQPVRRRRWWRRRGLGRGRTAQPHILTVLPRLQASGENKCCCDWITNPPYPH